MWLLPCCRYGDRDPAGLNDEQMVTLGLTPRSLQPEPVIFQCRVLALESLVGPRRVAVGAMSVLGMEPSGECRVVTSAFDSHPSHPVPVPNPLHRTDSDEGLMGVKGRPPVVSICTALSTHK